MKHIMIIVISAIVIVGAVTDCSRVKKDVAGRKESDTLSVAVMTVRPDTFTEYGVYYGRLSPLEEAKLICYAGGRVEALHAREGDYVKAGASLAAIDSAKAASILELARLQETIALKNFELSKKHQIEGNASQLATDQAQLAWLNAKSARIDAEKNYRGALAVTPLSGIVSYRSINLHQELPPGAPTFSIVQTSTMKVSVAVLESDASHIKPGCKTYVSTEILGDSVLEGRVSSMAREAARSDNTFRTEIHVANPGGLLKSGATAKVKIELQRHTRALFVPTEVIRTDGVQYSVMIVYKSHTAKRRVITPGAQSDTQTMITAGLAQGDLVIVSGHQLAAEGTPVRIVEYRNRGDGTRDD
jgi:RND family efflux transporter MFP subunit